MQNNSFLGLKKNKKGAMLSLVMLAIMGTLIVFSAIVVFLLPKLANISEIIDIPNSLDSIYIQEAQMNLVLEQIFENSLKSYDLASGKEGFVSSFKNELNKYKGPNGNYLWLTPELKQVENQISVDRISIGGNKISLVLNLKIEKAKEISGDEVFRISYNYTKVLEKTFKS